MRKQEETEQALEKITATLPGPRDAFPIQNLPSREERAELRLFLREHPFAVKMISAPGQPDEGLLREWIIPLLEEVDRRCSVSGFHPGPEARRKLRREVVDDAIEEWRGKPGPVTHLKSRLLGDRLRIDHRGPGNPVPRGFFQAEEEAKTVTGVTQWKLRKMVEQLDRPGFRWPIALVSSLWAAYRSLQGGNLGWPTFKPLPGDSGWTARDRNGISVSDRRPWRRTPTRFRELAFEYYFNFYTPGPGEHFVSVGAGLGAEVLAAAPLVGSRGGILAIEAHPGICSLLRKMVDRNRFTNVTVRQVAVGAESGTARISEEENHSGNSILKGRGTIEVPMTTLDALVREVNFPKIDFLHMNIEGAEQFAIRGMDETLSKTRQLCICCHDFRADWGDGENMRTKGVVIDHLRSRGFEIFTAEAHPKAIFRDHVYARSNC